MKISQTIYLRGILTFTAIICVLVTAGCGGKKPFRIDGTVEGIGTQNVTAIYHDGTSMRQISANAVNSVFHLEGMVDQPVVMELYDNQHHRIGCMAVGSGDELKVKFKTGDPYFMEASGNKLTTALAEFLKKNSGELNAAIERQISSAPDDDLTVLLAGYYYDVSTDAVRADSVLSMFGNSTIMSNAMLRSKAEVASRLSVAPCPMPDLRLWSSADSMFVYKPSDKGNTLYIFTDIYTIPDSIVEYADSLARSIRVASVRLSIDTFGWHKDAERFSGKVTHLWALGGPANAGLRPLNITQVPFYIVTDSTATQIYRGTQLPRLDE